MIPELESALRDEIEVMAPWMDRVETRRWAERLAVIAEAVALEWMDADMDDED